MEVEPKLRPASIIGKTFWKRYWCGIHVNMKHTGHQQHPSVIPAVEGMSRTPIRGRNPELRAASIVGKTFWNRYQLIQGLD